MQHGVGLFESLTGGVGSDGAPWALHLEEHLERLALSASELGLVSGLRDERRPSGRSSERRDGRDRHGSERPQQVAADGFDFSKPYESAVPHPLSTTAAGEGGRLPAHGEHPHKTRRPVAALLGGLGRK